MEKKFQELDKIIADSLNIRLFADLVKLDLFNFFQCMKTLEITDKEQIKNILLQHIKDKDLCQFIKHFQKIKKQADPEKHQIVFKMHKLINQLTEEVAKEDIDKLIKKYYPYYQPPTRI